MFKILKALFVCLLFIMLLALPAHAAVKVATMGAPDSVGNHPIEVDSDGNVTFFGGKYAKYEAKTTSDTLTAGESGKTYFISPVQAVMGAGGATPLYTLPDADVGLEYTFVAVDGSDQGVKTFIIVPQSTDYIVGAVDPGLQSFVTVGDRVRSPGNTGDSLKVICGLDLYWYTENVRGTFVDAN